MTKPAAVVQDVIVRGRERMLFKIVDWIIFLLHAIAYLGLKGLTTFVI